MEPGRGIRGAVVERDEIAVMFKRVADEVPAIQQGWADVEAAIGDLRGRKFFGAFDAAGHEYRVCTQLRTGDDPAALGLEVGTLAGGRYLRVRLRGEAPGVYELIGPTFQQIANRPDADHGRPGIEYYRSHDVIELLQPLLESAVGA